MTCWRRWTPPPNSPTVGRVPARAGFPGSLPLVFGCYLLYGDPLPQERLPGSLAPGAYTHLPIDIGEVALYGRLREVQRGGYLVVGEAASCEQQDLKLPGRKDAVDPLLGTLQHRAGHSHHGVLASGVQHRCPDG